MGIRSYIASIAGIALLASSATAQVATYSDSNYALSVNIPSNTASSGSGPIFFQISAPSGTQWVAFGQGTGMTNSNIFVVYAKDSTNVTLSARHGSGHVMPQHDSSVQVTLLEGSGINNGAMVANVRCDNCNSWRGGSMSFTDSSSNWIHAYKSGDALNSDDVSASISQHDSEATFSLDLPSGTGGSSSNPFVAASASGSSPSATGSSGSATGSATATNGVSVPIASSNSGSNSAQRTTNNTATLLDAHGIIMSLLFVGLFPFISLTLYLPFAGKVRYIHAPLQILATILLIGGMSLGIILGNRIGQLDGYHMIIGFIIVACLVLFQPAMGIYQHLHYHKTGGRSAFGLAHRWLGRTLIMLGMVNGGLGWKTANNTSAYVPYGIVAGIVFLIYVAVLFFAWFRSGKSQDSVDEKAQNGRGYEMQQPREPKHQRLGSGSNNAYAEQQIRNTSGGGYAIRGRP